MALRMGSFTLLVILSSLFLGGLCGSSLPNLQGVRVIETKSGVYDCVDFYKQPAFSHPLLKNQKSKVMQNLVELQGRKISGFGLKDDGCPTGTIPFLKGSLTTGEPRVPSPPTPMGHCVAIVHTVNLDKKFFGVSGSPTLFKPVVQNTQWTTTRMKLLNGVESIEAGWMVNPDLYKDNEAHFYAKFTAKGKECINLQCIGFVQLAKDVPLGSVPNGYSVVGAQRVWNISIHKQLTDGNWWLSLDNKIIGYWPKDLFTSLAEAANQVEWGGEIGNPGLVDPPPQMGDGNKASYNLKASAAIIQATVLDENLNKVEPDHTLKVWDCEDLYTVLDAGHENDELGRLIYYGGVN